MPPDLIGPRSVRDIHLILLVTENGGCPGTRGGNGKFTSWWRSSMHRRCTRGIVLAHPPQYNFWILQSNLSYVDNTSFLPKKFKTLIAINGIKLLSNTSCRVLDQDWCDVTSLGIRNQELKIQVKSPQATYSCVLISTPEWPSLKKESTRTSQPVTHNGPQILEDILSQCSIPGGGQMKFSEEC